MNAPTFKTFKVGPRNKKLEDKSESSVTTALAGYEALIESDVPLVDLLGKTSIDICHADPEIPDEIFQYADEGKVERCFELFEFPKRADYGRDGVDENFIREKLNFFGYRPATFVELLCFGGYLREIYKDQWYESKSIVALGSVATTSHVVKKGGWFSRRTTETYRHYPELICVSGRPLDQIKLTTTDKNRSGNWPNEILFLGTPLEKS
jgi:hypothetical protein